MDLPNMLSAAPAAVPPPQTVPPAAAPQVPEPRAPPTPQSAAPAHQPGVSAFPAARVTKIIKADADVDNVNKEAVFAISMATVRIH